MSSLIWKAENMPAGVCWASCYSFSYNVYLLVISLSFSVRAAKDVRIPFVDIRHCLAFLLKSVHDKIMWPLVTSRSEKGHVQPYPLADILHMSLASPEGYTLTCFIEILADVYCLLVKVDSQVRS